MEKLILALVSFYLGLGSFFSFYVAPILFRVLDKSQAGSVVEKVFPVYFGIGIGVFLVSLVLSFLSSMGKPAYLFMISALILLLLLEFYILPVSHSLKATDYQAFMRYHGISMVMNLGVLVLSLITVLYLIKR